MEMGNLQELIEVKKVDLIKLAEKYGFRHQQVLRLSQDIDILINIFININKNGIEVSDIVYNTTCCEMMNND